MRKCLRVKRPLFLSDVNEIWIVSPHSRKTFKCVSLKSAQWEPSCSTQNGQTDMTKLILAFRNFANAPKKSSTVSKELVSDFFRVILFDKVFAPVNIQRVMDAETKAVLCVKCPLQLPDFNQNLLEFVQRFSCWLVRTDGQTWQNEHARFWNPSLRRRWKP